MIPRVARSGKSFEGAAQYYLHDKLLKDANGAFAKVSEYMLHDKTPRRQTAERVGFTEVLNMEAETAEAAFRQMSASYERYKEREAHKRGRKLTKPVYAYSLAWSPDQAPTKEEMMKAAHSTLKALRLEGLQTVVVQHTDEPHPHIHIIVNRIEQDGQRARNIPYDHLRLSSWALQYEREQGQIYCQRRLKHSEMRRRGIYVKDQESRRLNREPAHASVDRLTHERQAVRTFQVQQSLERKRLQAKHDKERQALTDWANRQRRDARVAIENRFSHEHHVIAHTMRDTRWALQQARRGGVEERKRLVETYQWLLAGRDGRLSLREKIQLSASQDALERRFAGSWRMLVTDVLEEERGLKAARMGKITRDELERSVAIRQRHQLERDRLTYVHDIQREEARRNPPPYVSPPEKTVRPAPVVPAPAPTPAPALQQIHETDLQNVAQLAKGAPILRNVFDNGAASGGSNAADIAQRMQAYRRRRPGMDFGLEL